MSLFECHLFRKYLTLHLMLLPIILIIKTLLISFITHQNSLSLLVFYSLKICVYHKNVHSIREQSVSALLTVVSLAFSTVPDTGKIIYACLLNE